MHILLSEPRQPPASLAEDAEGRIRIVLNLDATVERREDTRSFAHVVADYLGTFEAWTPGRDLFVGPQSLIPRNRSPVLRVADNPGSQSIASYGDHHQILQVSAQVDLRAKGRSTAYALGWTLHSVLSLANHDLPPT